MNSKTLYAAILAAAIGSTAAVAQLPSPTLLKNFNTKPQGNFYSGSSSAWAQLGSKAYITFSTSEHGNELWTYDALVGPASLAFMTENLFQGDSDYVGNARSQIAYAGKVYFTAWTVDLGRELYATDGTVAGTYLVKDIMPGNPEGGPFTTGPVGFTVFGGQLFFTAEDGVNGRQLWKTDGTTAGTVVVDALAPNISAYPEFVSTPAALFYASNGNLFYLTLSPDTITDVDSVNYGNVQYPASVGTTLYFQAAATDPLDTIGVELYKSDGVTISLCKDIMSTAGESSYPSYLTEFNGKLYFAAAYAVAYHNTWGFQTRDTELYEYDPLTDTLTGSNLNTTPGSTSYTPVLTGSSYPGNFLENNNYLFFTADPGGYNTELWTLGTTGIASAAMLDPAGGGEGIRVGGGASPNYLTVANSTKIVFAANDGVNGTEVWESDGTTAGTILGGDWRPGSGSTSPKFFPAMGAGLVLFRGNNNNGWGTELHSYQANTTPGSAGVLTAVADVNPQGGRDGNGGFYNAEGVVDAGYGVGLFSAYVYEDDGVNPVVELGAELWRTDGTTANTILVKDIRTGSNSSNLREFCQAGTLMYFQASDGTVGSELYFANGVPEGQPGHSFGLAADIKPGGAWDSGSPQYITYAGSNKIVFKAVDGTLGTGYTAGLFWAAGASYGPIYHYETIGGISTAVPCYGPEQLRYHNGLVYFGAANDDTNNPNCDLFTTNGSVATKRTDMAWQGRPAVVHFDDANQQIYILGYYRDTLGANAPIDTAFGHQLYVIDSAFTGPLVRLTNEATTSEYGDPIGAGASYFADLNGTLFFRGDSVAYGGELWTTDGTAAGTQVFMDINPGVGSSGFGAPYVIDAGMVFSATNGVNGEEMWLSDGTVGGTAMIADTITGPYPIGDGAPSWVTPVGSRRVAYRYGRYTDYGSELWTCDGTAPIRISDINANNGDSELYSWTIQNGLITFEANDWLIGQEAYTQNFGASTKSFGITSAPPSHTQHATISCNDPVLGSPFQIKGKGALASSTCGLAVSFLSGEIVFQGLSIYVNVATFQIAGFTTADANGNFAFPATTYPNNANYHGADLVYQAASLNPLGLFKSRLTNALYMNVDAF